MNTQRGFTLVDLLVIIALIGVLAGLSMTALYRFRLSSANKAILISMHDARTNFEGFMAGRPDGTVLDTDHVQVAGGALTDANARTMLAQFKLGNNSGIHVYTDSGCDFAGCVLAQFDSFHCRGDKFASFIRYGDSFDVQLEEIPFASDPTVSSACP